MEYHGNNNYLPFRLFGGWSYVLLGRKVASIPCVVSLVCRHFHLSTSSLLLQSTKWLKLKKKKKRSSSFNICLRICAQIKQDNVDDWSIAVHLTVEVLNCGFIPLVAHGRPGCFIALVNFCWTNQQCAAVIWDREEEGDKVKWEIQKGPSAELFETKLSLNLKVTPLIHTAQYMFFIQHHQGLELKTFTPEGKLGSRCARRN